MSTFPVARRPTSAVLVGRAAEVADLWQAVDETVAGGTMQIVVITGEAGIGKTRLVRETVEQARARGLVAATGRCVALGDGSPPFAALTEALREIRAQFAGRGHDDLPAPAGVTVDGPEGRDDDIRRDFLGFVTRAAAVQPLVLAVEDLQWADAATRDLLAVLSQSRSIPVTLLLTLRADELHRRHPLRPLLAELDRDPLVRRVHLEGLARSDVAELLSQIGVDDADECFLNCVRARTGGNPLYVEELVAAGPGDLPDSLPELIVRRLERLPPDDQRMLRAASVVGPSFDGELLATVTGRPLDEVTAALRRSIDDHLLLEHGEEYRFRHALVREALYDDLLPGERIRLHLASAEALERAGHLPAHARWTLVAHHWDAGGNAHRAYLAALRAAEADETVHAYPDAAQQYERALCLRTQLADPPGPALTEVLFRAAQVAPPRRRARILQRIGHPNENRPNPPE